MNAIYIQTHGNSTNQTDWLSPFTSYITAIYVQREQELPTAYIATNKLELTTDKATVVACTNEAEILKNFWAEIATRNQEQKDIVVTFNGRQFVAPHLYVRSSINGIPIKNPDLIRDRYKWTEHVDLIEAFSFHGVLPKISLYELCALYKLQVPTTKEGQTLQTLLSFGITNPSTAVLNLVLTSGLEHLNSITKLSTIWSKSLRSVY